MSRVRLDQAQIVLTAQRATLPLVSECSRRVLEGAQRLVPVGTHISGSGRRRPGRPLSESLNRTLRVSPTGVAARVGTGKNYAASVHQGSDSHTIRGRGGRMLKFRWERGDFLVAARAGRRRGNRRTGQFHYFASVRHPGNRRPVQFLTRPLHLFGRFYGFRVVSRLAAAGPLP